MSTASAARHKLSKAPITLTLCQVRFSTIRKMASLIPHVQEALSQSGYELDLSDKVQEFIIAADGPQTQTIDRWEFADLARTRSVILTEQFAVYQTTKYDTFDAFAPEVLRLMDALVQAGAKPIVTRVGLRYTDAIIPTPPKTVANYLASGLLGVSSAALKNQLTAHNTIAETKHGRMLVRMSQNRQGALLPMELGQHNLVIQRAAPPTGAVITLLDFDHFKEWPQDASPYQREALNTLLWDLKNATYDVFRAFVTPEALEEWR